MIVIAVRRRLSLVIKGPARKRVTWGSRVPTHKRLKLFLALSYGWLFGPELFGFTWSLYDLYDIGAASCSFWRSPEDS